MLKDVLSNFYVLADEARAKFGADAPKITSDIIAAAFPETVASAEVEGCDKMLHEGVKRAVSKYIRKPGRDTRNRTFNDIDPEFLPLVEDLGSVAYYVPHATGGEYVSVPDLCYDKGKLNAARKFMRVKGEETLAEANKLDALFEAVFPA